MSPGANRILLSDCIVEARIGVFDEEKKRRQRVRINIFAIPKCWPAPGSDDLAETVSYDDFVKIIHEVTASDHIQLVETLAEKIAETCLARTALAQITVRVEKLDIYPFAIPGVEIVRSA